MKLRNPLFLAIALNILFFLLYILFGIVRQGSLDDYFMSSVLTGAYGSAYDVHTYFVGSAYGYFLKPFYLLFPKVGWYFLFELAGTFAAFTVFTYILILKTGKKYGALLSALMLAALTPDFYFQLSFTQCATAYTATGSLLFVFGNYDRKKVFLVLGSLFFIAGSVMRWEGFLLGLPFLGVLLLSTVHDRKKIYFGSAIALATSFALIFGLRAYDKSLYTEGEYKYYADYQPIRAFFGDGAYYDSESTFDELEERGMSGMDFRLMKGWLFYDTEVLCVDSLHPIADIAMQNKLDPNWERMPLSFFMAVSVALTRTNGWCWVIFCILLMIIPSRKANIYPWISLALIALSLGYLLWVNRLAYHVETGIWLYAIVGAIPFFSQNCLNSVNKGLIKKILPCGMILLTVIFSVFAISSQSLKTQWSLIETRKMTQDWKDFVQYAEQHSGDVFLLPFERYKQLGTLKDKPYKAITPGSWQNIIPLGYWNIHLPAMKAELAKRGISNPIKDIVKQNVYVIDDIDILSLPDYYSRHYGTYLAIDTAYTFGNIHLLKYRIAGDEK